MSSEMFTRQSWKSTLLSAVLGLLTGLAIVSLSTKAEQYVYNHLENDQHTYQFPLSVGSVTLNCIMKQGRLLGFNLLSPAEGKELAQGHMMIDFVDANPLPGAKAIVQCSVADDQEQPLYLYVHDPYSPGGLPDRIEQIVYVNNAESYHHDISAEPGEGWHEVSLSNRKDNTRLMIKVELAAINPDVGWSWGRAAGTRILLTFAPLP